MDRWEDRSRDEGKGKVLTPEYYKVVRTYLLQHLIRLRNCVLMKGKMCTVNSSVQQFRMFKYLQHKLIRLNMCT